MREHTPASNLVEIPYTIFWRRTSCRAASLRAQRHVEADVPIQIENVADLRVTSLLDVDDGEFVLPADDVFLIPVVPGSADFQDPSLARPLRHDRKQIATPQPPGPELPVPGIPMTDIDRERVRVVESVVVLHSGTLGNRVGASIWNRATPTPIKERGVGIRPMIPSRTA